MIGKILHFFDKLEDHTRRVLSHYPITYALIGALGIVLLWKGVWEVAGEFPILDGMGSVVVGLTLLLSTGLLVSFFVGEGIIISGIKGEKKLVEKTEQEVRGEEATIEYLVTRVEKISEQIEILEHSLSRHK
jgi:hypothetical protein